jgi:hypothetical protein
MVEEASELSGEGIVFDAKTRDVLGRCGYRLTRDVAAGAAGKIELDLAHELDVAEPAARDNRLLTLQTAGGGYQSFRITAVDRTTGAVTATPDGPRRTEFTEARPSRDGRKTT